MSDDSTRFISTEDDPDWVPGEGFRSQPPPLIEPRQRADSQRFLTAYGQNHGGARAAWNRIVIGLLISLVTMAVAGPLVGSTNIDQAFRLVVGIALLTGVYVLFVGLRFFKLQYVVIIVVIFLIVLPSFIAAGGVVAFLAARLLS